MTPLSHILLVSSTLDDDGGIPVCVAQLSSGLAERRCRVEIVGSYANQLAPVLAHAQQTHGLAIHAAHESQQLAGQLSAARRVAALITRRAKECRTRGHRLIVHNHGVWLPIVLAAANTARRHGARLVITPHGMLRAIPMQQRRIQKLLVFYALLRRQLVNADAIQATSQAEATDLKMLLPWCDPVVVPLGIVPPQFSTHSPTLSPASRTAGYLGRLIPIKNIPTLLRAWHSAAPSTWMLRIVGTGEPAYEMELRSLAESLGITNRVTIEAGIPYSKLGEFFSGLNLFILPSRSEAFGLSIGEALASGVPVIATTTAPWANVVTKGCGWSVSPDQSTLELAIREATSLNNNKLSDMGQRGAMWVLKDFSWATIVDRHIQELYRG